MVIWFIIISVNLVLGASVLFTWIRCWPLQKMWHSALEGSCWNRWITIYYNMFTAGMLLIGVLEISHPPGIGIYADGAVP